MEWWMYVLIALGIAALGLLKLKIFSAMRKKSGKKRFTDED